MDEWMFMLLYLIFKKILNFEDQYMSLIYKYIINRQYINKEIIILRLLKEFKYNIYFILINSSLYLLLIN